MKFKVGDKVRFLDEEGGGIISKLVSPTMVNVATEDGFEIPCMTRDLVKIEAETVSEKTFDVEYDIPEEVFSQEEHEQQMDFRKEPLFLTGADKKPEMQGVYLAFVPVDQKMLISGSMHVVLINSSQQSIQFRIVQQGEKGFDEVASAKLDAFAKFHVAEVGREEIEPWLKGHVQMIFNQDKSDRLLAPVSAEYRVKGSKLYKESSYKKLPFLNQQAIVYELIKLNAVPVLLKTDAPVRKDDTANVQVKAAEKKQRDHILKHRIRDGFAEVDMHIWELVDNYERMSNAEMQQVQMDYFRNCLESAIEHRYDTVVFIHGVGTGKLKQEVRDELKKYENLGYKDASMADYGVGATRVDFFYGKA